ncbi:MAG: neutral/alkaline non-lysosomal ceramidase N-terminal domain-containing protein [Ardenticatenaceae bacterium]|nr:neutral/alkaline non-lysosomal ceramidase N-terminal domain-containing protein [Ardenticatenaceae bacterium]
MASNTLSSGSQGQLQAGVAKANITPAVGAWLAGYDRDQPSQGVHDELYGEALVLADRRSRLAILSVDLIALGQDFVKRARQRIYDVTGIPPSHVLLAASHTHAGPVLQRLEMFEEPDPHYLAELEMRLAGAVYVANNHLQEATLGMGTGRVGFNVNRRLVTPDGVVMRPNLEGPVDHTVGVIRVDGPHGEPLAVLMHYACHATAFGSSNLLISADFPGAARHFVEQIYGPGCTAMFLQGCSGDVRPHVTDADGLFRGGTSREVLSLGRILGAEVVRVCEEIRTRDARLAAGSQQVALPFQSPPSRAELASLVESLEGRSTLTNDAKLDLVWARWLLSQMEAGTIPHSLQVEIQVARLGQVYLVALPGEAFVEIGRRVQAALDSPTFVIGCANGVRGYLPTAAAHRQRGRNYEVNVAYKAGHTPAPLVPEAEDLLVEAACSLAAELHKEDKP